MSEVPQSGRPGRATLVALGVALARRGILAGFALAVSVLTVLGMGALAVVLKNRDAESTLHDVPLVASSALAWGGGFALAFGAAVHALRRDVSEGLRDALALRSVGLRDYLVLRVGGLAALVALVVAGGSAAVGLFSALLGLGAGVSLRSLQATFASVLFGVGFAIVIAPTAIAALGARTRVGGYMFLLGVVVLPELAVTAASSALPHALADVLSIPSALGALRASVAPGSFDVARLARATVALAVFTALTIALVRREARGVLEEASS